MFEHLQNEIQSQAFNTEHYYNQLQSAYADSLNDYNLLDLIVPIINNIYTSTTYQDFITDGLLSKRH